MSEHFGTDAIIAVGEALRWNVAEGMNHLGSCEDCRAELEALGLTRASLLESEPIDDATLRSISAAVSAAAVAEHRTTRARDLWALWTEALVAGVTMLVIAGSGRVPIDTPAAAALAFALGAILMVTGRVLARRMPAFDPESSHA